MVKYYPSKNDLTTHDKLERVFKDVYDRLYDISPSTTPTPAKSPTITQFITQNPSNSANGTITTVPPLLGGAPIDTNPTLSITQATTINDGYVTSTDWNTFNNKVSGSGTTNQVPKFTASATLGDSVITELAGNVGIGTVSPNAKLDVLGTAMMGDSTTNYTSFTATGHESMAGSARPWRDELGQLIVAKQNGNRITDNATEGTVDYGTNTDLTDYKITSVQLNHDRDLTSNIYPHLHWFQTSSAVPNWLLQYRWQVNGQAKVTSWTSLKCNVAQITYTSGTILQICEAAAITPPGNSNLSDIIQFRILRDNANTSGLFTGSDPLAATASALYFDLHIVINSIGSTSEYVK